MPTPAKVSVSTRPSDQTHYDVTVLGSGLGSLTAACLLAHRGLSVNILEANYLPGGCTSSYWRKGFVFEAGATTLVGLDPGLPLRYLLDKIGVDLPARRLELPMQVHLADGQVLNRFPTLESWIAEAERIFGPAGQRPFWEHCQRISQFVWETSLRQTAFPPERLTDLPLAVRRLKLNQLRYAPLAFVSTWRLLARYSLDRNAAFTAFVNEQLLITAQNHMGETNALFGATALAYTLQGNYYLDGGLINLVNPLIRYLENQGSTVRLRCRAESVTPLATGYRVVTNTGAFTSQYLISGLPLNTTLALYPGKATNRQRSHLLDSPQLNSAFQMGIGFRRTREYTSLHHQIHLATPLPGSGSRSIFLSLSHPADSQRCSPDEVVASVSTHLPNPAAQFDFDKEAAAEAVFAELARRELVRQEDVLYWHSSAVPAWEKWTGRPWGFVGGYPQYFRTKPWQMAGARLDGHRAYLCGDTVYPGQGIPGVTLSGIIAAEKLERDWL